MPFSHLLIFTPGFPSSEEDTTCLPAVQQFLLSFQQQYPEIHITVVSLHYPFTSLPYKWNKINIYPINGRNKAGLLRGVTIWKAMRRARSIHKHNKVDAVLSFWLTDAALAGKYFSDANKIPHLVWMHGQDARQGNKYVNRINPLPYQLAAISQWQHHIFQQSYQREAGYIINNGINPAIFPALNTGQREIDILAAGNLIPLKQYDLFIELLHEIIKNGVKIKAVLAGEGVLMDSLLKLRDKYGLENNLDIVDKVSHQNLLDLMNHARIFVHPSSYEGHSTVMLEALYSGCKVVSFVPPADAPVNNSIVCTGPAEMSAALQQLLLQQWVPERVLVNDMKNSATQIFNILQSQVQK